MKTEKCLSRRLNRVKMQLTEKGKLSANHVSDKGCGSWMHREPLELNSTTIRLENGPRTRIRRCTNGQQAREKCSSSLVTREEQPKCTRYHLTRVSRAIVHKTSTNKCGEDVEKREPRALTGGNVKWGSRCGKQRAIPTSRPSDPVSAHTPEASDAGSRWHASHAVFAAAWLPWLTRAEARRQPGGHRRPSSMWSVQWGTTQPPKGTESWHLLWHQRPWRALRWAE